MDIELYEALAILYKGQSNVALMAKRLDMPLTKLQQLFKEYVRLNPIDSDLWQGDVELSWPFVC